MKNFNYLFLSLLMFVLCGNTINAQSRMEERLREKFGCASEQEPLESEDPTWYKVGQNGHVGVCDYRGVLLVPLEYDDVNPSWYWGYIKAVKDKKTTIFDIRNEVKVLMRTNYEDVRVSFENTGFYEVRKDGKWGVINNKGKLVIPCEYEDARYSKFNGVDYCEVKKNGKWGEIDMAGRQLVPCEYDYIESRWHTDGGNYREVKKDGKQGVIDKEGRMVVPCKYDEIILWQFTDGNYCEVRKGDGWGVCDKNGREVIPCDKYEYISPIKKHYVVVSKGTVLEYDENDKIEEIVKNGKWGIYDLEAEKEIVSPQYDYIGPEQDGVFAFNRGGHYDNNKLGNISGGKWGYLDTTGKEIIPAQYDAVSRFENGVAQVTKDGVVSTLAHPLTGTPAQKSSRK